MEEGRRHIERDNDGIWIIGVDDDDDNDDDEEEEEEAAACETASSPLSSFEDPEWTLAEFTAWEAEHADRCTTKRHRSHDEGPMNMGWYDKEWVRWWMVEQTYEREMDSRGRTTRVRGRSPVKRYQSPSEMRGWKGRIDWG
ncbi:MAG: hypothetical protein M1827_000663 [Pycnora praestabilis]|nr:MAG: hypothetical protein M1827_000663 [Pycnora praestabilis]